MAIAFDPGIGFGKTVEHNLALLANLPRLRVHDRPIVVGVSRKSSLGTMIGSTEMSDRLAPTIAFTAMLRERGANVLRHTTSRKTPLPCASQKDFSMAK
jgi:dihydropteroate synthase